MTGEGHPGCTKAIFSVAPQGFNPKKCIWALTEPLVGGRFSPAHPPGLCRETCYLSAGFLFSGGTSNKKKPRGLSTASGQGRDPGVNTSDMRDPGRLVKPFFKPQIG